MVKYLYECGSKKLLSESMITVSLRVAFGICVVWFVLQHVSMYLRMLSCMCVYLYYFVLYTCVCVHMYTQEYSPCTHMYQQAFVCILIYIRGGWGGTPVLMVAQEEFFRATEKVGFELPS